MKPTEVLDATKRNLNAELDLIKAQQTQVVSVDELKFQNKKNSELITLQLTNSSADRDINITFGTPLSVFEEYKKIPMYDTIVNHWLDNLASLTDNQGAEAPFLQLLNRRFLRKSAVILQMEIITPNNEIGLGQRTEQTRRIYIPFNSVTDSSQEQTAFIPQYTEYNASLLLSKAAILGDFSGLIYKLRKSSTISINMTIGAIDTPNFNKPL
jgi:hypothetical protein